MNCRSCGAVLNQVRCDYCGVSNSEALNENNPLSISEEIEAEVDNLYARIERLRGMLMPDAFKNRKIEILEKKISELKVP